MLHSEILREHFLTLLQESHFWANGNYRIEHGKAAINIRTGSNTPITIEHDAKSCRGGLSIGFHRNFSKVTKAFLPNELVPKNLADGDKPTWSYTCFDTAESIELVVATISKRP